MEGIRLIEYVLPRQIFRRAKIMVKHRTFIQGIRVLCKISEQKIMVWCKIMEGIRLIEYVLPRQIFRRAKIMVKHRTFIQGIKVLRKMSEEKLLKIIIIKSTIHLLLNL